MDLDTVKAIAESAARSAAAEVNAGLARQVGEGFARLETSMSERISTSFKLHFGEMDASKHVIQHDRVERILNSWDKASQNLLGKALIGLLLVGLVAAFGGEFLLKKLTGFFT